jgi:quercetin dioxygenase-like cupin family protein
VIDRRKIPAGRLRVAAPGSRDRSPVAGRPQAASRRARRGARGGLLVLGSLLAVVSGGLAAPAAAQSHPPAFPRPGATKILENQRVIVWDVVWRRDQPTPMHEHRHPAMTIVLAPGRRRVRLPDNRTAVGGELAVGTYAWTERGAVHADQGLSDPPLRAVVIEIKDRRVRHPAPPPGTARAFSAPGSRKLFENRDVVLWDVAVAPSVPLHYHDRDLVAVVMGEGRVRSIAADGSVQDADWTFGAVRWAPGGRTHREEVLGGAPRAMILELK